MPGRSIRNRNLLIRTCRLADQDKRAATVILCSPAQNASSPFSFLSCCVALPLKHKGLMRQDKKILELGGLRKGNNPMQIFLLLQATLKFSPYSYFPYPIFTALTLIHLEIGWFCPSHVYTGGSFIWLSSFRDQFLLCGRRDYWKPYITRTCFKVTQLGKITVLYQPSTP